MKLLWMVLILLSPGALWAQSKTVLPHELSLSVTVNEQDHTPFTREMIMIEIHGVYRRHITREQLIQPDFDGFSWSQLGPDVWTDERLEGEKVKILRRRMAIYPDRPGTLTIGAFTHKLTLTDEVDDWFEHEITSKPITITVAPIPVETDWWFPVRRLKVADQWSNAPDQLAPGEGVLRIVQIEALGVTPEMIPPMPSLNSPSAMIFAHPEKRLVELTPEGPVTYAFWRWTIRPSNDTSTIVEPLDFEYFDTFLRETRNVTISAQRVAYGAVTPQAALPTRAATETVSLPRWPVGLIAAAVFFAVLAMGLWGHRFSGLSALQRYPLFDPLSRQIKGAAGRGDINAVRRASVSYLRRGTANPEKEALVRGLDHAVFAPGSTAPDLRKFARELLRRDRAD